MVALGLRFLVKWGGDAVARGDDGESVCGKSETNRGTLPFPRALFEGSNYVPSYEARLAGVTQALLNLT